MKPAYTCNTMITILVFVIASSLLIGIAFADCSGIPCPFSPFISNSSCGSCECGNNISICSVAGTCALNELPVYIGSMTPGIAASTVSGPAPLSVQFRDTAGANEGTATWTWDFGDGSTGTGISPVHVFQVPGRYNVTLTVSRGEKNANLEWGLSATTQSTTVITVTPGATVRCREIRRQLSRNRQEQKIRWQVFIILRPVFWFRTSPGTREDLRNLPHSQAQQFMFLHKKEYMGINN